MVPWIRRAKLFTQEGSLQLCVTALLNLKGSDAQ